ncbi:hypothetical protein [Duganella sp. CF517]|uniref:hypothetical protein n=1 Tax=Duganella sp. CF517 TaxID=1881038 RepID=UPI000B7D59E2|nr:hypothetical protein [Duganella sp. CF517]
MDEQITQLDRRLTAVERDIAVFTAEARAHYATKEDLARLEARIAVIQSNYATTQDISDLRSDAEASIQALEVRLIAQIAALEGKILDMENRHLRWTVGAIVAVAGIVLAIVRTFP